MELLKLLLLVKINLFKPFIVIIGFIEYLVITVIIGFIEHPVITVIIGFKWFT
jgi:hypothetical protein